MEVFISRGRDQKVVEVDPATTVSAFLAANGLDGDLYVDDAADPLDHTKSLGAQGIMAGAKLVVGRCHRIEVTVRFAGQDEKHQSFAPGAAVRAVFAWATGEKGFDLTRAEAAKHTFQVCAGTEQPDPADHIGSWAGHDCKVCFDLVPKQKFEG